MHSEKMTVIERRAVTTLSAVMGLRMLGLFMVLPVFALYAEQLHGATPILIGIAMGIYGLLQALLQIPLGALSDRIGRKPVILLGLFIFAVGSMIAASAHSISWMIFGRALQGAGAVGSTILAMIADFTREEQRTKSMAIAGITIGFAFSLAMFLGPLLIQWIRVDHLFLVAIFLSLLAIFLLYGVLPTPPKPHWHRDTEPELNAFFKLLRLPALAKLNVGIFILHALFTASFIVIPINLSRFTGLPINQQWHIYLPALLAAFMLTLICIHQAEKKQQLKPYFLGSIILLILAEILLAVAYTNTLITTLGIGLFFAGFSLLEAMLPSLTSRTAPANRKGTALGIFSCTQFLGIFVGGSFGGWLYGKWGFTGVYLFCTTLALFWLILSLRMQPPRYLVIQTLRIQPHLWESTAAKLNIIPGIIEMTFVAEDNMAYLKMERNALRHPEFLGIKEQLQTQN